VALFWVRRNAKAAKRFLGKALKGLINPVRGFKSMKSAYATFKGFEVMYIFKKGQFKLWLSGQEVAGEIRLITYALINY